MRNFGARAKRFCGTHPLFALALVVALCVVVARASMPAGWIAVIAAGTAGCFLTGWRRGAVWTLAAALAVAGFATRTGSRDAEERALLHVRGGTFTGTALDDGARGTGFWSVRAVLADGPRPGAVVWWKGRGIAPVIGSQLRGSGIFAPLPPARNPGEFDHAAWLKGRGVAVAFEAAGIPCEVTTDPWAQRGAALREGFRNAVTAGLPEDSREAMVIRAVVIGEPPPDAEPLVAAFRNSGTLHAFSVSGLHVAMVGTMAWIVLQLLGIPRRWAVVLLLPLIFGYAWLTGSSAPALRSAWMAAVFLGAFVTRRRPDLLNALGAVLLLATLWDGRLLFQPGVQLSYGVVAIIAIAADRATRCFAWIAATDPYLPVGEMRWWQTGWLRFRRWVANSLGVSVAAGAGSTPLTALHFGLVTPVSILAGVVFVPEVFALLAIAMVAALVHPFWPAAARAINDCNAHVADACVATAEAFAAVPGGHFQIPADQHPSLLVYALDHGGGAACFQDGHGAAALIDCGDPYDFQHRIAPSLRRLGVAPDSIVLSHPDGAHLGGGAAVWEILPVRQVLLPVMRSRSPAFRQWTDAAPKAGIRTMLATTGQSLAFPDDARLETILAPDPDAHDTIADHRVAIFRLHWKQWKILFTSDAGMNAELDLLDRGVDVKADVIVAGKHETDGSLCDAFISAVAPRAIIASNSPFPPEERLDPASVAYWESRGIAVFDQAQSGGVTLHLTESGGLRFDAFSNGVLLTLPR